MRKITKEVHQSASTKALNRATEVALEAMDMTVDEFANADVWPEDILERLGLYIMSLNHEVWE